MRQGRLLTAILLLACACQEKIISEYITVEKDSLELSCEGDIAELVFTTNAPWKVTSSVSWCEVYPNSGSGRYETENTLKLVYDENTGSQERQCEITIEYGSRKKAISVMQNHSSIIVYDKLLKAEQGESTITVNYWAKEDIIIETDPNCSEWISILPGTKALDSRSAQVRIKENTSTGRTGKIYLRSKNKTETVEIQQHAANIKFKKEETRQALTEFWRYIDKDGDGEISLDESAAVKELNGYFSLTVEELSYFTSLEKCTCQLIGEDYNIQNNPNLKELSVYMQDEGIKEFKISESVPVSHLSILNSTDVQRIDLRGHKSMNSIFISNLEVSYGTDVETVINLDGCSNLQDFYMQYSPTVVELSLKGTGNLMSINVNMSRIQSLELKECTSLGYLSCDYCENLSELDVSNNKQLREVFFFTYDEAKKKTLYLSKDNEYYVCRYNEMNTTVVYR